MEKEKQFEIEFEPSGRGQARNPSNPDYPEGIDLVLTKWNQNSCLINLPYPAPECGLLFVVCNLCTLHVAITVAGRADDPRTIRVPCILKMRDN